MANGGSVAVVGLGSFGSSIAQELADFDDHVLGIDIDEARVSRMSKQLSRAVIADARDEQAMEEAGLGSYDTVVVAIATNLECSVLSVMTAQTLGVARIYAKANNPTHARILRSLGVHGVLQPERDFGGNIAHMLHNPRIRSYAKLSDTLHLVQLRTTTKDAGRTLGELKLSDDSNVRCLGVIRGSEHLRVDEKLELAEGDGVLLLGKQQAIRELSDRS